VATARAVVLATLRVTLNVKVSSLTIVFAFMLTTLYYVFIASSFEFYVEICFLVAEMQVNHDGMAELVLTK